MAGAVGPKLFLAKAGQYGFHNYTTDWGKTFDIVKTSSTTKEFMGFAIREITPAGKKLLLNDSFGKFFIFDPSANTYEPFAGGASYEIPEKNMRITPLALTNNQLNGNIGVYQDIGLTNQIRFLAPNHLRAAHSAVSIGNVMVVGFQGGVIRDEGADFVTGGFGVYVDGKQVNFFRDSGSVFNLKRNVIYASGKIIAYSWRIWVSDDGINFQVSPGSPPDPVAVYEFAGYIFATTTRDGLYYSTDRGASFKKWTASIK